MTATNPSDERAPRAAGSGTASGTERRTAAPHVLESLIDALASSPVDVLPGGWYALEVPGVGQPLVIGPGGLFVLLVRHHTTLAIGLPSPGDTRPWAHDHRNQLSTPQLTAELASQLVNWACGTDLVCSPVIVVTGDDAEVVTRPDGVDVIHEHMLTRWLARCPAELDEHIIGLVTEHLTATRLLPV